MAAPTISHVLETSLYAADATVTAGFYEGVLGLKPLFGSPRLIALDAGASSVVLVFQRGMTEEDTHSDNGTVPGHDGRGRLHLALAVPTETLADWRVRLAAHEVAIIAETRWARGGTSIYFHDPDGHVVELATPGLWANY